MKLRKRARPLVKPVRKEDDYFTPVVVSFEGVTRVFTVFDWRPYLNLPVVVVLRSGVKGEGVLRLYGADWGSIMNSYESHVRTGVDAILFQEGPGGHPSFFLASEVRNIIAAT